MRRQYQGTCGLLNIINYGLFHQTVRRCWYAHKCMNYVKSYGKYVDSDEFE